MRIHRIVTSLFVLVSLLAAAVNAAEEPWITLFDGKTLDGWHVSAGSPQVVDGRLALAGGTGIHCVNDAFFSDFVLTTDVLTESGAAASFELPWMNPFAAPPANSLSLQLSINNSRQWSARPRTGSLAGVACQFKSVAKDGEWFRLKICVQGGRAQRLDQ